MRKFALALSLCSSVALLAADTPQERLSDSAKVFNEIMATPDKGIPQDLLEKANCIVIVPGMKQAAFVIGGKFGRGYAVCRQNGRHWGGPAAIRVEGGSFGFQIGGSETDVVLLVMNQGGAKKLLSSKFTLGADASVAGGPVGRTSSAATDAQMHAEILTYSRARGLFAGVSLEGATLRPDDDWNKELYGKAMTNSDIVLGDTQPPASASKLLSAINKYSSRK
jgi:lipid-binding SYLF domain-containing protein